MDIVQKTYLLWLLGFVIDNLTHWFSVFNCLPFYSYLFFYNIYFKTQNKALIGRSKTPTTSKMEIFVEEVMEGRR